MPQIFTLIAVSDRSTVTVSGRRQQGAQRRARIGRAHERLADQERVVPGACPAARCRRRVSMPLSATAQRAGGNERAQALGSLQRW